MKKIYLVYEKHKFSEYSNKEEAEIECENQTLFNPENSYEVVEQKVDDDYIIDEGEDINGDEDE
jgi:endoglucanase Acf2